MTNDDACDTDASQSVTEHRVRNISSSVGLRGVSISSAVSAVAVGAARAVAARAKGGWTDSKWSSTSQGDGMPLPQGGTESPGGSSSRKLDKDSLFASNVDLKWGPNWFSDRPCVLERW